MQLEQVAGNEIVELMAIRAGLSSVYSRNTKIRKSRDTIKSQSGSIDSARRKMDGYEAIILKRETDRVESRFPYDPRYQGSAGSIFSVKILSLIIFFSGVAAGGYLTYLFYNRRWYEPFGDFFSQFGMIGMLIGLLTYLGGAVTFIVPVAITFFISITVNDVLSLSVYENRKSKADSKVRQQRQQALSKKMSSTEIKSDIENYKAQRQDEITRLRETIKKANDDVEILTEEARSIYSDMIANLTHNIKPVDWQYIDLLIYYFETGRATTTKEALNLLEQQIVTNQIVKTLNIGTQYITESIKSLGNRLNNQLNSIDERVSSLRDEFRGEMTSMQNGIDYTCAKVDILKNQNNSLYRDLVYAQKVSSEELVKSISNMEFKTRVVN